MSWISHSIIALFSISFLVLILKRLTQFKMEPEIINFYFFLITTIFFFFIIMLKRTSFQIPYNSLPYFILAGFIAIIYNYFSIIAIDNAPNPGYVEAIVSFRVIIILFLSLILFDSQITLIKLTGIIFCSIGLLFLSL